MLGMGEAEFVLHRLASIPAGHVEQALLLLPFHHVSAFLRFADALVSAGKRVELVAQCVFFLLRIHHAQISTTQDLLPVIDSLLKKTRRSLQAQKDVIGFNLAAMRFLQQQIEAEGSVRLFEDVETKLAAAKLGRKKKAKGKEKRLQVI